MKRLAPCIFLFAFVPMVGEAAEPPAWTRIDAGNLFSFEAPPDTKAVPVRGIDSFVGRYSSSSFTLSFDYGPYSNDLSGRLRDARVTHERGKIDGKPSLVVTGPDDSDCVLMSNAHIVVGATGDMPISLTIGGCAKDAGGIEDLHRLFQSIRFAKQSP